MKPTYSWLLVKQKTTSAYCLFICDVFFHSALQASAWTVIQLTNHSGNTAEQSQVESNTADQSQVDRNTAGQSQVDSNTADQSQVESNTADQLAITDGQ